MIYFMKKKSLGGTIEGTHNPVADSLPFPILSLPCTACRLRACSRTNVTSTCNQDSFCNLQRSEVDCRCSMAPRNEVGSHSQPHNRTPDGRCLRRLRGPPGPSLDESARGRLPRHPTRPWPKKQTRRLLGG